MNTDQQIFVPPHYEHWSPGHNTSTLLTLVSKSLHLLTVNIGESVVTFHTLNTGELVRMHQYCRDVQNAVYVVMYNIFIGKIILHEAHNETLIYIIYCFSYLFVERHFYSCKLKPAVSIYIFKATTITYNATCAKDPFLLCSSTSS